MKLTLANIQELKRNSDSPLLKRVCNYVIDRWSDYNDKKGIFTDVLHYGCQSGIVGELIYYHDTVRLEQRRRMVFGVRRHNRAELWRRYQKSRVRWIMKVYLVKLDWSTEDSNDIELFVYGTYDKA